MEGGKRYDGKVDMILCSGGDGTLNHVVSAMIEMAKAIYPEVYKDLEDPFANDNAKEEKPAA